MRVTDKMGFNQVAGNLQKNRSEIAELQNQAATQKRVNKPSDDPVASTRVLSARTDERGSVQFTKDIQIAKAFLEYSDLSLSELSEVLFRMKELAIQQANDAGASSATRRITAMEVEQAYNQAIQIGNRKLGERYIFGGYKTTQSPFTTQGKYMGDDGDIKIHINKDAFVAMNIPGNRVFLGEQLGPDGLIRAKAVIPKNAQDLIRYKEEEKEERKKLEEKDGQMSVFLRGPASIRPGSEHESELEADGENQNDSSNLEKNLANEKIGINVLETVKNFEIGLRVDDKQLIQDSIDHFDQALTQVVHARAQLGSRIQTLNQTLDGLQKSVVEIKGTASQLEDADLFQVVSDMTKADTTLKATLETSGKIIQPSLLDFLR